MLVLPRLCRRVTAAWGVVVAMGAWSGDFLAEQTGETRWADAFHPRRGLLLEMPRPADMPPVAHGLMEMGYTQHYSRGGSVSGDSNASAKAAVAAAEGEGVDITFTATTSASGTLLVGSSRCAGGNRVWDLWATIIWQQHWPSSSVLLYRLLCRPSVRCHKSMSCSIPHHSAYAGSLQALAAMHPTPWSTPS